MSRRAALPAILLLLAAVVAPARALEAIPAEKRIAASVVGSIAAPGKDPLHMPTDVAIDSQGRMYVADGANGRIIWFSADGQMGAAISQIDGQRLQKPVGIFVDAKDQLWIADRESHLILTIGATGRLAEVLKPPTAGDKPAEPTDVVVTGDGRRVYVADNAHHRILVYDRRDNNWMPLGQYGRALGQFQYPFMLCIGPDKYVSVTEAMGARVRRISPGDKWAGQIGAWGVNLGEFYRPKGVAADKQGRIFVSDSTLGVVQVFSSRGRSDGVLTGKDGLPLRFEHPMGMSFDKNGRLYVVELKANRVAVVEMK